METTSYNNRKNNTFILYVILVAVGIAFFIGCSRENDYEKGTELLKDKKYAAALEEFQEVESDDPNYRLAQSKINYIYGLQAFNDSLMSEAKTYLVKVETDDEYYHDTQLMIEKINESLAYRSYENAKLATKTGTDTTTIVVKEEVVQQQTPAPETREPNTTDRQINRNHVSQLEGIINKFEMLFQSARNSPVSSKSSLLASMRSVESEFHNLAYRSNDPNVIELRQLINSWMNNRLTFVNQQVSENIVGESESSRKVRAQGDNIYYAVNSQLKKVKAIYAD